jgi:hypothetical protein
MKRKDVDDVLGGEDHWKHADSTAGLLFLLHISFETEHVPRMYQPNAISASTAARISTSCKFAPQTSQ